MSDAKVISLSVRPSQVSHLCFEVGGILGELYAELGDSVTAFDFKAFYAILGSMPTVGSAPSRLIFDFLEIQAFAHSYTLAALRAESSKAALNSAINARQNAFLAKYGNISAIVSKMQSFYTPTNAGSKFARLSNLSSISENQKDQLQSAYSADSRTGVIKQTVSSLNSTLRSSGSSNTKGRTWDDRESVPTTPGILPTPPDAGQPTNPSFSGGDFDENLEFQEGSMGQTTDSTGSATEIQTVINTDYGYRMPSLENLAQNERAQISLMDEMFDQYMLGLGLPNLEQTLKNELNSIDGDVFRLQIAYLNTVLLSPTAGTVTGIYKGRGDSVKAGEPVVRVENNEVILLVALLKFRGLISIGSNVTVNTTLFDSPGPITTIAGTVVAARGQTEDDHWEVIVKCDNLDAGTPIFPIGYHFDYDNTTLVIS